MNVFYFALTNSN